jgi:hypothetical protein
MGRLSAYELYEAVLRPYSGSDIRILRTALTLAVDLAMSGDGSWNSDMHVIERAFRGGVIPERFANERFLRSLPNDAVPFAVAANIVENASRYPAFLVAAAERSCRLKASEKIRPVAAVAASDHWFV